MVLFDLSRDTAIYRVFLLPGLLLQLLASLSFPKAMRWNETGVRFARPIRWLLSLHDRKPVRIQFARVKAGDTTVGHRFLSSGKPLVVRDFKSYMSIMQRASVMVDPERVEWVFADADGRQLRTQPAAELSAERIRSLTVTNRR